MIDEMIDGFTEDMNKLRAGELFLQNERYAKMKEIEEIDRKLETNRAKQRLIQAILKR